MKNKALKYILCLTLAIISVFAFACANKTSLVDFNNKTERVALLSYYVVDISSVSDTDGHIYEVNATVKDSAGTDVDFSSGRFLVTDRNGYTVKYTADLNGKSQSRTVTLEVYNPVKPILRILDGNHVAEIGETYSLPTAVAVDAGGIDLDVEFTVMNDKEEVQTIDAQNKTFTPSVGGAYKVVASATDVDGNTATDEFELFVRNTIQEGEVECFDDKGSYYTVILDSRTEKHEWHENVLGRDGVMQFNVISSNLSGNLFKINTRKPAKEYKIAYEENGETKYRDPKYVVFSMYVQSDENVINDFSFLRGSNSFSVKNRLQYNQWTDYVFDASAYLQWMGYNDNVGGYNEIRQHVWGVGTKDYTLYIDKIIVTDTLEQVVGEVEDVTVGQEVSLKSAITSTDGVILDYNVYLADRLVAQTKDKFIPQWKGEYKVVASAVSPAGVAVEKNSFTFNANGVQNGHMAKLNDYTDYIEYVEEDESTHNYVLPAIEIFEQDGLTPISKDVLDEYTFTTKITRKSTAGVYTYDSSFSKTIRGFLTYDLTAYHPTYGSFRMFADVTVGPIAQNEVADFTKADAVKQTASRNLTIKGQTKNIFGESDPERYQALDVLHIRKEQIGSNDASWLNIIPVRTAKEYQAILDGNEDGTKKVVARFPVFVETTDMATRKSVILNILGIDYEVPVKKWTNVEVPVEELIKYINNGKLYTISNYSDYILAVKPTTSEPFYDGVATTRIDLDLYMGNITVETVDIVPPTPVELENVFSATEADLYKITSAATESNIHIATAEELALVEKGDTNYQGGAAVVSFGSGNCPDLTFTAEMRSFINNEWFIDDGLCGYNYLSVMYAVVPNENGGSVTITSGLIHDWFTSSGLSGNYYSFSETKGNVNKWVEYLIPVEKILSYGNDVNKFRMAVRYSGSSAQGLWTAYVGEIKLKKVVPTLEEFENPFLAKEENIERIFSDKKVNGMASAQELSAIKGTGDFYKGEAVSVMVTNGNGPVLVYTPSERALINNKWYPEFCGYNYISVMFAIKPAENFKERGITITGGLFHSAIGKNYTFGVNGTYPVNTWINFVVPVENLQAFAGDLNRFKLISTWFAEDMRGDENAWTAYVGDVKLLKEKPDPLLGEWAGQIEKPSENLFVANEENLERITSARKVNGMATSTELSAIKGTGTFYKGNAVSVEVTQGNGPALKTNALERAFINNEKYPELNGYKYLSIYVAVKPNEGYEEKSMGVTSGLIQSHLGTAVSSYLWFGSTQKYPINTWINFIVPIDNLLGLADTAVEVRVLSSYLTGGAVYTAYVGDITMLKEMPADYTGTDGLQVKCAEVTA